MNEYQEIQQEENINNACSDEKNDDDTGSDSDFAFSPPQLTSMVYQQSAEKNLNKNIIREQNEQNEQNVSNSNTQMVTKKTEKLPDSYQKYILNSSGDKNNDKINTLETKNRNNITDDLRLKTETYSSDFDNSYSNISDRFKHSKIGVRGMNDSTESNVNIGVNRLSTSSEFDSVHRHNIFDETVHMDPKLFAADLDFEVDPAQVSPLANRHNLIQRGSSGQQKSKARYEQNQFYNNHQNLTSIESKKITRSNFASSDLHHSNRVNTLSKVRSCDELSPLQPARAVRSRLDSRPNSSQSGYSISSFYSNKESQLNDNKNYSRVSTESQNSYLQTFAKAQSNTQNILKTETENTSPILRSDIANLNYISSASYRQGTSSINSLDLSKNPIIQNSDNIFEYSGFNVDSSMVSNSSASQLEYSIDGTTSIYPDTMLLRLAATQTNIENPDIE
ncbi:hypothetical protein BB561_001087 [Smittium simulii]|uniref:Uncharacterized protein n=1 Tax=Smittium simulii TaxID=133385 RepID=A0A2T9YW74_9FUNG|nr:hypothetical protein BB561_001087 [Smittium simulii]